MRVFCFAVWFAAVSFLPAEAEKVTIKVFTQEGVPVEGAQVLISEPGTCPIAGLQTPTTDEFGKYTDQVDGIAAAYVYKPGFVQSVLRLEKGTTIFRLERSASVTGSVVDKSNRPVEGATVMVIGVTRADGSRMSFS